MQDKHLYEYAVVRVVPRVEREEFMNVGVVLFCKRQRFLKVLLATDRKRLQAFCPALEVDELYEHLSAFEAISTGGNDCGPIGKLDTASRFRWLTATRSTVVQTSKIHPGFCNDLEEALQKLFMQLVG